MITGFTLASLPHMTRMQCTQRTFDRVVFFSLSVLGYHIICCVILSVRSLVIVFGTYTHTRIYILMELLFERCCMLLFILHWMSLESNWQICCLLFISPSYFFSALLSLFLPFRSRVHVCCVFFFVSSASLSGVRARAAGFMRILFYLHYMIFFIFYVALSFHSSCFFFSPHSRSLRAHSLARCSPPQARCALFLWC